MTDNSSDLSFSVGLDTDGLRNELGQLSRLSQNFGTTMVRAFSGAATSGRKFSDVLKSLALSLSRQALSAAIKPLSSSLGGLFNSAFSSFSANANANANGNAFSNGRIKAFANGGIVNSPTLFPMMNQVGLMGEAGPEAVMPLARGADGKLGVRGAGSGSAVSVTMNISTPDAAGFARSQSQIAARMSRAIQRGQRNL